MRGSVIVVGFFTLTSGCTNVLGIDGDYVLKADASDPIAAAGGLSLGGQTSGGTGGESETPEASAGGAAGTGGEPAFDANVPPPDAGDTDPSCRPGHYEGTLTGMHAFNGIAAINVEGSVSFRLDGAGDTLAVDDGRLSGQPSAIGIMYGSLDAAVEGTYDCKSGQLNALLVNGSINIPPLLAPIDGTLDGDFDGTSFSGNWHENETQQPSARGSGTWSATWMRP